jgi:hypothetical protein
MGASAIDLSTEEPRPMTAILGGYAWLPRMIDKARASRAGTLGEHYRYPCPIDRRCLELLGLDSATFADIACAAPDDSAVLDGLVRAGAALPEEASFDPVKLNEELHDSHS